MTEIIAEIGSNPCPGWDLDKWCKAVSQTGAQKIKIQVYRASHFPEFAQAEKRRTEFPRERLGEFARLAHAYGLAAGASVFDAEAVELCARELDFLKLAAREQNNSELWRMVWNRYGIQWHPGTRSHTVGCIYRSISDLRYYKFSPFSGATLYVIQRYPARMIESLFRLAFAYRFFRRQLHSGKRWGWSSHTCGDLDCVLAARLGASIVEKHFALTSDDPEAGHSLLPDKFSKMVRSIKR